MRQTCLMVNICLSSYVLNNSENDKAEMRFFYNNLKYKNAHGFWRGWRCHTRNWAASWPQCRWHGRTRCPAPPTGLFSTTALQDGPPWLHWHLWTALGCLQRSLEAILVTSTKCFFQKPGKHLHHSFILAVTGGRHWRLSETFFNWNVIWN